MNFYKALFLFSLLFAGTVLAQQDELLAPEKAYSLQGQLKGNQLIAEYQIAPGYYMYRKSFKFASETPGVTLDEAQIPDGHKKHDEFFGEVEVYRGKVAITVPVNFKTKPSVLRIKAVGQGCADIGVCYPPLYQTLQVNPADANPVHATLYQAPAAKPAATPTSAQQAGDSARNNVNELQNLLGEASDTLSGKSTNPPASDNNTGNDKDPLALLQALGSDIGLADDEEIPEPDKAFQLSTRVDDNNVVHADIKIYDKTYLYQDKVKVELIDGKEHQLGPIKLPQGDHKNDEFFGEMVVYHHQLNIPMPILPEPSASGKVVLSLGYQGCVEDKICYPPITKYLSVDLASKSVSVSDERPQGKNAVVTSVNKADSGKAIQGSDKAMPATANQPLGQSEQDKFTSIIAGDSLFIIIGSFFLAGVLLTFTPCVFPMIPILSGIIAGQGDDLNTRKAFWLSLVYVLAMATTYAIAGSLVGMFGAEFNIQAWFQDPLILSIFAGIFVLLALSMFGFYDLQMPSFIQSRLTEFSNKQRGGNLIGVGIMGMLSALIVGPCITAPLVGALVFISQTQDVLLGGLALFALGLGMGLPLLLIGTSAGKYLPRAGTWMDAVKAVFGVALIAVAIWLLERILPTSITMLLMALLIIVSAIYMGALESVPEGSSGWRKLLKGLGFTLLIYGLFYLYGVAAGSKDLIQPLKGISASTTPIYSAMPGTAAMPMKTHVQFQRIKGQAGLKKALADATAQGKPVMLDFYADWCISCKQMEKYAFKHPAVLAALSNYITIQADVTANDETDKRLMKSLDIYGPPAIIFYDRTGKEIPGSRVVGEMSGEEFAAHIVQFANQK